MRETEVYRNMTEVTLRDARSGAEARIAVSRGMNCYSWTVPGGEGNGEVLWAEDQFASGAGRPSGSGIPILFPFAGRIAGAEFTWKDRTYSLPPADGMGNALHGFVMDRPWRIESSDDTSVTGLFRASVDLPGWQSLWPSDFELKCRYELDADGLRLMVTVTNPTLDVLPCGLGLHPYFRVDAEHPQSRLELPVEREYELEGLMPTGNQQSLAESSEQGVCWSLAGRSWDNVYGNRAGEDGVVSAAVVDGGSGRRISIEWESAVFPFTVIYTPPHREAVCVEPYSALPNPFELEEREIENAWWKLAEGESLTASVRMTVR